MKSRVMYIEFKGEGLDGPARIGRVTFSNSGLSIYYNCKRFARLKGGYKANYYDVASGERYWISGCKKRGGDRLYAGGSIEIDEDTREEYWVEIRNRPDLRHERVIRGPRM
jgi:hypothetical protein